MVPSRVNVALGLSEPTVGVSLSVYPMSRLEDVPAVNVADQTSLGGIRTPGPPSAGVLPGWAPGRS